MHIDQTCRQTLWKTQKVENHLKWQTKGEHQCYKNTLYSSIISVVKIHVTTFLHQVIHQPFHKWKSSLPEISSGFSWQISAMSTGYFFQIENYCYYVQKTFVPTIIETKAHFIWQISWDFSRFLFHKKTNP